jgi:hypothetical protein
MEKYLLLSPVKPNNVFFGEFNCDKEAFVYFASKMVNDFGAKGFNQFKSPFDDPKEISFHIIKNDGNKLEAPGIPGSIANFTVHKLADIAL